MVNKLEIFIDVAYESINKYSEELCGDNVEIVKGPDSVIVVLADGLGSGVKANILATLTSNIAATMLKRGADIFEVVDTLSYTLPKCKVRELAYSTFTIFQIFNNGNAYIVEFDNPQLVMVRDGQLLELKRKEFKFQDKTISEIRTKVKKGDVLTAFSDGVVHAGIGGRLNLGWKWENVAEFLLKTTYTEKTAKNISKELIQTCKELYCFKPGDDATAVTVKVRDPEKVILFTGPPKNPEKDIDIFNKVMSFDGKKIICGGTAANIFARELGERIETDLNTLTDKIPPIGKIKGIDLVTEGVLTLSNAIDIIKLYISGELDNRQIESRKDGASLLADILINKCTHLKIVMGSAINPAHQNPNFPNELGIKWKITQHLIEVAENLGKQVDVEYIY